ncbi:WD40 repeat-like protein [Scenedesmus sp. NREL 46B-D3]|nr:WD40 repeat-like protein [Scenedesmus sp. NREL 46B-D3]
MGPPRPPGGAKGGWMTVEDVIGQQPAAATAAAAAHADAGDGDATVGPPRPPAVADDADGALVGPPRPPAADVDDDDADMAGPPRPAAGSDDESEEDDEQEDVEEDPYQLPIGHEVALQGHERAVSCLDIEHSGNRLVSGSLDYTLRIFDFNGMKSDLRSFREFTPSDGHPVLAVSWSPTGDAFLCVTGSAQPRFYDRDGKLLGECARGDMYIRDMKNTKGHITGCSGGCWHPIDRYTAVTSSEDGTVRIWDTNNILQKTVVRPTTPSASRVGVTTCAYNSDGKLLAAGMLDGTIQVWGVGGKFGTSAAVGIVLPPSAQMVEKQGWSYVSRPNQIMRKAHEAQNEVSSLAFSQDDRLLASRSTDGSLKLWDLRAFKSPLAAWDDLPTNYATTNVTFSPDERLLLTGTGAVGPAAAAAGGGGGAVVFVDVRELKEVRRVGMPSSVAAVKWHGRLNQIFAGVGDKRGGATRVLYDTTTSERGALLAVGRAPRQASMFDAGLPLVIKTPHALPMYKEDTGRKRSRDKARMDPIKSRKPDPGATAGLGRAGRIGATGGTLLTQHLLKTRGKLQSVDTEMDPREAILRHANTKDDQISMLTAAYAKTQPKPVFAEPESEEEDE